MKKIVILIISFLIVACDKVDSDIYNDGNIEIVENKVEIDTVFIDSNVIFPTIRKGFYGFIIEWKGDFMPGPDCCSGTIDSVQMDVYVYNKLTFDSIQNARTEQYSWFWYVDSIKQVPIKIIKTNSKGYYEIDLPIGEYTGLIKIDDLRFYTNGGNRDGHLGCMILENDTLIKKDFNIDYEKSE